MRNSIRIDSILSSVYVTTYSHEMRMRALLISANVFVVQVKVDFSAVLNIILNPLHFQSIRR